MDSGQARLSEVGQSGDRNVDTFVGRSERDADMSDAPGPVDLPRCDKDAGLG